jgi:hypothetical protein
MFGIKTFDYHIRTCFKRKMPLTQMELEDQFMATGA